MDAIADGFGAPLTYHIDNVIEKYSLTKIVAATNALHALLTFHML